MATNNCQQTHANSADNTSIYSRIYNRSVRARTNKQEQVARTTTVHDIIAHAL